MPNTIETIKYCCLPAQGLGTTCHPTAVVWARSGSELWNVVYMVTNTRRGPLRSSRPNCGWERSTDKRAAGRAAHRPEGVPGPRPRPRFRCSQHESPQKVAPSSPGPESTADPFRSWQSLLESLVVPCQLFQRQHHARCSGYPGGAKRTGGTGRRVWGARARVLAGEGSRAAIPGLWIAETAGGGTAAAAAAGPGAAGGPADAEPPLPCCTSGDAGHVLRLPRQRPLRHWATPPLRGRFHTARFRRRFAPACHPATRIFPQSYNFVRSSSYP